MNDSKSIAIKFLKSLMFLLFPVCLVLSFRWSSLPMIRMPSFLQPLFLQPAYVDASMLNLATGYVSGYIVYLLTVVVPTFLKNRPMQIEAARRLSSLYRRNILVLFLMCKNACTKEQWSNLLRDSDFSSFNEDYYERMRCFDIKAEADTLYLHEENRTPLTWYEYLEFICDKTKKSLDEIFLQFNPYLPDDMLKIIVDMKNSHFIGMFTDFPVNTECVFTGKDGYLYFDHAAVSTLYAQDGKPRAIFSKSPLSDNSDNIGTLKEYILVLKHLYQILSRFSKGIAVESDYATKKLIPDNAGHYNTAVFKDVE